ncbi:hypothetical protein [Clostridium perfringens]|uniref:hypothetical protein n=1 Tax=Clostridium perfringens TaxID=1502 RepID=UPI0010E95AD4|nr:hypothetical protein [Clostridium perfringens]EJT6665756.1 hypothetical protein [Clostridium perfringens]MBO3338964.1 hypothetical protein [Clostridium perfringens]MBO3421342.1 hypothetical protein [Clostridium perfringens]MBO3427785.1 hypothetical protein [Clostridium perfringens]MCX0370567.1 hypothetical protein [Clostridium perfringens]
MKITINVISEEERQVGKYLLDNINEFTDLASIYEDLKDYGTFDEVADILVNLRDEECINIKDFCENGTYGMNPKRIVYITDIYKDVLKEYLEN